jgi:hypothetical protein
MRHDHEQRDYHYGVSDADAISNTDAGSYANTDAGANCTADAGTNSISDTAAATDAIDRRFSFADVLHDVYGFVRYSGRSDSDRIVRWCNGSAIDITNR